MPDREPDRVERTGSTGGQAGRRLRTVGRFVGGGLMILVALLAAAFVSSVTSDLGPALRALAEREGSARIDRRMEIGGLSVRIFRGEFVLENLVIEGLAPGDRPFLRAGRVDIRLPLWTLFRRELLFESVEMTDWEMVVETYPDGTHSFPRFAAGDDPGGGPRPFVTTVQRVRAHRGQFTFQDHGTPWSAIARNLDITVARLSDYRGRASFSDGTVQIQDFEPMRAGMTAHFGIDGRLLRFGRIDLETDGARSFVTGHVDLAQWPEQLWNVRSQVDFPRMREIFWSGETFDLHGEGEFTGTFHIYRGGRELEGTFRSDLAGLNDFRFPRLEGSLRWLPDRFDVSEARSDFSGGRAQYEYSILDLGGEEPAQSRFDARYENVDLAAFTDFLELEGIRLAGRASGHNLLAWPLGAFAKRSGHGEIHVDPPAGATPLERVLPPGLLSVLESREPEAGPFDPRPGVGYAAIGGEMAYAYGPEWIEVRPSRLATGSTFVAFEGRTAWGEASRFPFHVTSADWQESNRLLAGILTAFGSPTRAVPVGGYGEFDGVMLGSFTSPRVEGRFSTRRVRAWDVEWGEGAGEVVIENAYADVAQGIVVGSDGSTIAFGGRFSLGSPRSDGGEEIDARFRLRDRPVADLRHAFDIDDYQVDGRLSGEFHVFGAYEGPHGFGRMTIEDGVVYGEPFETATAGLRFEGEGVRLDGVRIAKGTGQVTGAAWVGWDGSYSFSADGRRIPVDGVAMASYPRAPLSGLLEFSASGAGTFETPRYDVRFGIRDLFVIDEGIGQVTGRLAVRGEVLTGEVEAASPRLAVSGSGRIALTPEADAEVTLRFADTSIDPYVRLIEPRLSPFTTLVASGVLRVVGELRNLDHLSVDGAVEQVDLRLFDYQLQNEAPLQLRLEGRVVRVPALRLLGEGTGLDLAGEIDLRERRMALQASGDANLGILQGFFRDIRSSGDAQLEASISGPFDAPVFAGSASISLGRIRHFSLPHSIEALDGVVSFDAGGIRIDDVRGRLGGGDVRFGGRIGLRGYTPGELNVTATGERMRLRYPEGFRSIVDADLALRGDLSQPLLSGTVNVASAVWVRRFDTDAGLFDLGGRSGPPPAPPPDEPTLPLALDVRIVAPSTLRIENSSARIVSSAELTLSGTYDRPLLFGRARIERGEVFFEGNRYVVTRGSVDFANPARIEPFFDIEAETRVRVPGQTYRVVFRATGTSERFVPELTSDPPLPAVDILSLLFGEARDPQDAELRALRSPQELEQELLRARAARLLTSPIASGVGRVVEEAFGVDTVTITPYLADPSRPESRELSPAARLTIGKRVSDRLFLTFSRGLGVATRDQVILLEYTQSDRLAWIVSQNEDRTYALDFHVRHVF